MQFDILKLHIKEKDIGMKGSWIKVSGISLTKKLRGIVEEIILKKGLTKTKVYSDFSKIFNCHFSTAKRHFVYLSKANRWVPLFFISKLLEYWKTNLGKSNKEIVRKKYELQETYEYLKVGQQMSPKINCVKRLNVTFCKIAGAHAADGHLNRKNGLILEDGDIEAVKAFRNWIKELFGIERRIFQHKNEKGWRYELYNKTIVRYLQIFFGFPIGKKCRTVDIPEIIKNSNLEFQKAFLCGAFTFDGSMSINGNIIYGTCSKYLADSCYALLTKLCKPHLAKATHGWIIKIKATKEDSWIFEPSTSKHEKLKFLLFKGGGTNLFQTNNIERAARELGIFDLKTLSKSTGLKDTSLIAYIKIMLIEDKIKHITNSTKILQLLLQNERDVYVRIEKKRLNELFAKLIGLSSSNTLLALSNQLNIPKNTLSRWRNRRSGVPLSFLREWAPALGINFDDLLEKQEVMIGKRKFYEYVHPSLIISP